MSRASEEFLSEIHEALAQLFLKKLRSGELTASELSVIRQFLKDNGITADPTVNPHLRSIVDELPDYIGEDSFKL